MGFYLVGMGMYFEILGWNGDLYFFVKIRKDRFLFFYEF